ncbi:glycoside hydrolase family 37 protein [Neolentinus lepideus HHB14362 ss-1]|uniref:Trehalase n=1 Tax=Neolentinus lepideus HHB14362 ss-1 TaxID=1314782 RepID=A0A165UTZ9_9AGAM|nr:glycoside hydrolase family 37 protein [Neolentinus lepideus HHB14362 ss-1]
MVAAILGALIALLEVVSAAPQAAVTTVTSTSPDLSASTASVSTAVASPSAPLSATLPSQVALPSRQSWCPSEIFCAGSLLQTVNVAQVYSDSKTFVDKPTVKSSQQVLSDFNAFNGSSVTEGDIVNFVDNDFGGEGLELEALTLSNFNANPAFLQNVSDPLLRAWSQTVHGYWTQLIRGTNQSVVCAEGPGGQCESSFIPLNHTFVIPGGRFREQYYWDSFWIVQGLIQSELYDIVNSTLQNFMDELDSIGFIPNGGRIYYLNRSQPPLFIHMISSYIAATNDVSILDRALPLAERELQWWLNNRSVNITSPYTQQSYTMYRYAVTNSAPRPESYLTDYLTANDPTLTTPLTESEKDDLYSELASGAETGWDYSSRWTAQPGLGGSNNTNPMLRSLNVKNTIPICLNSILYKTHLLLADLYTSSNGTSKSLADSHHTAASSLRAGILDLFWDPSKLAFYDFNLTSSSRNSLFSAATFYPLWSGIVPDEVLADQSKAFGVFSALNMVLNRYNGTFPVTFLETGLQWDAPNAWPPHQYIALEALGNLPSNLTSNSIPTPSSGKSTYDLIPSGQLGVDESDLPGQPIIGTSGNATKTGSQADINTLSGTIVNGGNSTDREGWAAALQRELANRYFAGALCSWHATGGSIPGLLPRLSDQELNYTQSINNTGNMFEKFSNNNIDSAGSGGEYTVQAGFGWTNGVALWIASNYGKVLVAPQCPSILEEETSTSSAKSATSMVRPSSGAATIALAALVIRALLQG